MGAARNIEASAVNTIDWLSSPGTNIVVPVYQRQYRWDIGGCEQLLADVRAVAEAEPGQTHFIGSVLSTASTDAADTELVLIDGQQRITTLMLLVAALAHTVRDTDPPLAAQLRRVLVRADDPSRTKLRPHRAWAEVFEEVVLDRRSPDDAERASRFDDNYAFFRSRIGVHDAAAVWRGLTRLEHVAIALGAEANAQQTFESLNSTGEPLRDHELIHNYVLMGLTREQQTEIEDDYWLPIERATGEAIAAFWRHYLIMTTGRELAASGHRSVYDAFRQRFPRLDAAALRRHATQWRAFAEIYRRLLDPSLEPDPAVRTHTAGIGTFGRVAFPLAMRAIADHGSGHRTHAELLTTLQSVESLLLRREIVGVPNDRIVARLCRAHSEGESSLIHAVARITPSNERVRVALKFGDVPHPGYVLGRLASRDGDPDVIVDHIAPLAPGDDWTPDGVRLWGDLSDDEQNAYRALAQSLGNVVLLEDELAIEAIDAPYPTKRRLLGSSAIPQTRAVAEIAEWSTAAIAQRTAELTAALVATWPRAATGEIDDDGLTPILDAKPRRGWPHGWEREFSYVEYRGEHWEVYDVRYLFHRIITRLWADDRAAVVRFTERNGGPIFSERAWNGQWDTIDATHHLYMGWDSTYMLRAVQDVLLEAGIAPEVFVKYSYIGAAM
jgi:hypothetical protein